MAVYKYDQNGKTAWAVKVRYDTWNGERKQKKKIGFLTKKEAQEWESNFLNSCKNDVNMTFSNLVEKYLTDCSARLAPTTMANKEVLIKARIIPYFGHMSISEIGVSTVRNWQNAMITDSHGYSPTYLRTLHGHLSAIFNYAVRYYGLQKNPAALCGSMGKQRADGLSFWTMDEFNRFISSVDDPTANVIFNILFYSGIREGELLALTPSDFDFNTNTISITKSFAVVKRQEVIKEPKTPKSKRTVVVPEMVMKIVKDYLDRQYGIKAGDRIFDFTREPLYNYIDKYCSLSGVKRIRIHDIRHSHASMLIELGVSPLAISERLGHEDIQTTLNTYSHLYPNKQGEIARLLASKITSQEGE